MTKLNYRLKYVLPVVFAGLLPVLSLLASGSSLSDWNFVQMWLVPFVIILTMWNVIMILRDWRINFMDWKKVLVIIIFIVILIMIYYGSIQMDQVPNWALFVRIPLAGLMIFIIQEIILTQARVASLLLEKEQLQSENFKIQLKELRNQMDPHFFFNALNTLRSMVRQNNKNSEKFIMGLSDFYRQILKHNDNTTLPLEEEFTVLRSYLFLMQSRNEKALIIELEDIEDKFLTYKIPTLALQSVVENCFKHNSMSSNKPLKIVVRIHGGAWIEVRNNIQKKLSPPETSGIGLNLLKKRYQLLHIDEGVKINKDETSFSVRLKLIPA